MLDIRDLYGQINTIDLTGQIDSVGVLRILGHIKQSYPDQFSDFDPKSIDWFVNGDRGKISKQIPRIFRQQTGIKMTENDKRQIGTVARYFSGQGQVTYDLTDDFTWRDGDYGDSGSCFWWNGGIYRGAIYDGCGSAIRVYRDEYRSGSGRAWILPCHDIYDVSGDFDSLGEYREYVIFNDYGSHDIQTLASVLKSALRAAHMVPVRVDYSDCHTNGGTHYLITDRPVHRLYSGLYDPVSLSYDGSSYPSIDLAAYDVTTRYCTDCQCRVDYCDTLSPDGFDTEYCQDCFDERYGYCFACEMVYDKYDLLEHNGDLYCPNCYDDAAGQCDLCDCSCEDGYSENVRGYDRVCKKCMSDGSVGVCDICSDYHVTDDLLTYDLPSQQSVTICFDCDARYADCMICGIHRETLELTDHGLGDGYLICRDCQSDAAICHNCSDPSMNHSQYYDPRDLCSDVVTLCDRCATANPEYARLVTLCWPYDQLSLMTECQSADCNQVYDAGIRDSGLCWQCERQQRIPYVHRPDIDGIKQTVSQGLANYRVQRYRQYLDALTPDLSDADPVALLTGPISADANVNLTYYGSYLGTDDPVCLQCDRQRVRVDQYGYMGRSFYYSLPRDKDGCMNCCHRPDAITYPIQTNQEADPVSSNPLDYPVGTVIYGNGNHVGYIDFGRDNVTITNQSGEQMLP